VQWTGYGTFFLVPGAPGAGRCDRWRAARLRAREVGAVRHLPAITVVPPQTPMLYLLFRTTAEAFTALAGADE